MMVRQIARKFPFLRVFRASAMLVLLLGFLASFSSVFPQEVSISELSRDFQHGRATSMHVIYVSPKEVRAQWSTGLLGEKEHRHQFDGLGSEQEFVDLVRASLDNTGKRVSFDSADPLSRLGGLSMFIPILYWRLIEPMWLKWVVLATFLAVIADICVRRALRAVSAGYWLGVAVLLGVGALAYLWSEPSSLLRKDGVHVGRISGGGVVGRTLGWAGGFALLALAVLAVR